MTHTEDIVMFAVLQALITLPYTSICAHLDGSLFRSALGTAATIMWTAVALPLIIALAIHVAKTGCKAV